MKSIHSLRCGLIICLFSATIFISQQSLRAQVTWSGAGSDDNWSTPANWGGITPTDGSALIFGGSTRLINTNDLTLVSNSWLRFDSDGFVLNGNALSLTEGITNSVGTNRIGMNVNWAVTVGQNLFAAPDTELVISGTLTNTTGNHTNTGGGRIRITGGYLQSVNPPATILNNIEYIVDGGSFVNGGGVRITSGTTPAASKLILTNDATMEQNIIGGAIRVGDSAGIQGQLIIDNSTLTLVGNSIFIPFASGGIGSIVQNGGTNSGGLINFCNNATTGGNGSYDMAGGLLATTQIKKTSANGTATMSFDGSTVRALAASTTFFTGLNTAEIKSGGLTFDNNGFNVTVNQIFSGDGGLTKVGSGIYTSGTGSTYTGGFTLNEGTVSLTANNVFGTGTITLNGGTVQPSAAVNRNTTNAVIISGNFASAGNANFTFSGPTTLATNPVITVDNANLVFSGAVGETGGAQGIIKTGAGTLQLTGAGNSFSGATIISNGAVQVNATARLGNDTGELVLAGGTFQSSAQRTPSTAPIGNPVNLVADSTIATISTAANVDLNFTNDSIVTSAGTLTFTNAAASTGTFKPRFTGGGFDFSRPIVLLNGETNFTQLGFWNPNTAADQTISGEISGTGSLLRNASVSGTGGKTILTASNSFTGGILLRDGSIGIGHNDALSTGIITADGGGLFAAGSARTVTKNIDFTGGLVIDGAHDIEFAGTFTLGAASRTITVNNSAATTLSGAISSTVTAGSTAWEKSGLSTLLIPVANSYQGDTLVSLGELKVTNPTGSATGSGTVIVTNTGVLSGTGTIASISLGLGGKVSPGSSVGTLTATNNATFADAGAYLFEMSDANTNLAAGVGKDFLNIQDTLDITATSGSPFVIDLSSLGGLAANFDNTKTQSWVIATAAGGISGFSSDKFVVSTANFQNNLGAYSFSTAVSGNNLLLSFGPATEVPQPTIDSNIVGAGTTNAQISFSTVSGASYTVQYKTNLNQVGWLNLTNFTATGTSSTVTDNADPVPSERYYQVISP